MNEKENLGWIKLSRKIRGHWLWERPTYLKWWLDLLMLAEWQPRRRLIGSRLVTLQRGQLVASVRYLCERWMYRINEARSTSRMIRPAESTVTRFLRLLEGDGMIVRDTQKMHEGTTLITICNYETYNTFAEGERNTTDNTSDVTEGNAIGCASGSGNHHGNAGGIDDGSGYGCEDACERGVESGNACDTGGGSGVWNERGNDHAKGGTTEAGKIVRKDGGRESGMDGETHPANDHTTENKVKNIRIEEEKKVDSISPPSPRAREENLNFVEIPSWEDVMKYFETRNRLQKIIDWEGAAEKFFNHFEAKGWRDAQDRPIVNWKARASLWISEDKSKQRDKDEKAKKVGAGDARRGVPADAGPTKKWGAGF